MKLLDREFRYPPTILPPAIYDRAFELGYLDGGGFTRFSLPTETEKLLVLLNAKLKSGEIKVENP